MVSRIVSMQSELHSESMSREKRALISEGQIIAVVLISAAKTRFVFTAAEMITLAEISCLSLYLASDGPRDANVGYFAAKFHRQRREGGPTDLRA